MPDRVPTPDPEVEHGLLEIGAAIDGYRIARLISARHGIDAHYEATAPDGSAVAITVLDRSHVAADRAHRREVMRLARIQASLTHPHLLPVLRARDRHGLTYFVTPLARGETLGDRLRRGPLEPAAAVAIAGQLAGALELAAAKGVVHRDLRPDAVTLLPGSRLNAVITDFGIACPTARGCDLLDHGESMVYRSPEEMRGAAPRLRSLVYSLACILVECLTGAPPYRHGRPLLTMHAHLVAAAPRPSERDSRLPRELDALIADAMHHDPHRRPRSPVQLVQSAGRVLGVDVHVPVAGDRKRQRATEKAATRERRRVRRRAARTQRRKVAVPRRSALSLWAGVALAASAISGFATGAMAWTPKPATAPPAAAPVTTVDPHATYLEQVDATITELASRRAAARQRLRAASGHRAQAAGARALAAAYRDAKAALPSAPMAAGLRLERSLGAAEHAYAKLAVAARETDPRAWRRATMRAVDSELAAARALRALQPGDPS
jgi:serine/threonine-protein kinase